MNTNNRGTIIAVIVAVAALLVAGFALYAQNESGEVEARGTTYFGNVATSGTILADGAADAVQLTAQGYTTQTNSIFLLEQSDGTDLLTVSGNGHTVLSGERDAATGYDYFATIQGYMTGIQNGAKTYGLYINMSRPAGYGSGGGDLDDAGLKIRVDSEAITTTAGTTLRGADIEAKVDNPNGTIYNLYGASITAKSDTSAGPVSDMEALQVNVQNNAEVTTTLRAADFRLMRQAATEPTTEQIVRIRNSSTSGNGVDAGIYFESDASNVYDDFDYVIDMSAADVDDADIRLSNGETIKNTTDTAIQFAGFTAFEEATVIDLADGEIITPTATYQPLTVDGAGAVTVSATLAIADGPVAGTILILVNEDDQNIVIKDGANTKLGGDITLTANNDDSLMLIWDGEDWVALAFHDN